MTTPRLSRPGPATRAREGPDPRADPVDHDDRNDLAGARPLQVGDGAARPPCQATARPR
jgi:hypothetical protein